MIKKITLKNKINNKDHKEKRQRKKSTNIYSFFLSQRITLDLVNPDRVLTW